MRILISRPALLLGMALFFALVSLACQNAARVVSVGTVTVLPADAAQSAGMAYKKPRKKGKKPLAWDDPLLTKPVYYLVTAPLWHHGNQGPVRLEIRSQGCVMQATINEQPVPGDKGRMCPFNRIGSLHDVGNYMHYGANMLNFIVAGNADKPPEFRLYSSGGHFSTLLFFYLACACVLLAAMTALNFERPVMVMALLSLFFSCFYFWQTDYVRFGFDAGGHVDYVRYLVLNHQLPSPTQGWQTYHPPLYYLLCAAAYEVWELVAVSDPMWAARFVSLALYQAFVVVGLLFVRRTVPSGNGRLLASALVIFWTLGMVYGSALNNDALAWLAFALTLLSLAHWSASRNPRHLGYALAGCGLAFLAKNSALLLAAIIGIVFVWAWRPWRRRRNWTMGQLRRHLRSGIFLAGVACLVTCMGLNIGRTLYWRSVEGSQIEVLIGNRSMLTEQEQESEDELAGYFRFDLRTYLKTPFYFPMKREKELPYFWNSYFATWLFGRDGTEIWTSRDIAISLALMLPLLLLFALTATAWRIAYGGRMHAMRAAPWALVAVMMVAGLMYARFNIPIPASSNARYIYPVTLVLAALVGQALAHFERRGMRGAYVTGAGISSLFVLLSILLPLATVARTLAR